MEVIDYANVLWRRKGIVVLTITAAMLMVYLGVSRLTPLYRASATLRCATTVAGNIEYVEYDILYADRLMHTYAAIASSTPVRAELAQLFNTHDLPAISVTVIQNTELMQITAEHADPELARDAANSLALILVERGAAAYSPMPEHSPQLDAVQANDLSVSVVDLATLPDAPFRPNKPLYFGLGAIISAMAGAILAFFNEATDTRLRTADQIEEAAAISVLGEIPVARGPNRANSLQANPLHADSFSRTRANILAVAAEQQLRVFAITSAEPEEGKSVVTANLAVSLGQSGRKVVAIDADMRRPSLQTLLRVSNGAGLSDLLAGQAALSDVIKQTSHLNVSLIASGSTPPDPPQLLNAPKLKAILDILSVQFEVVLIDTPAFLAVSDATAVVREVEGVILVVRQNQLKREVLLDTIRLLSQVNVKPIGIVLNRAKNKHYRYSKHYQSAIVTTKEATRP